MDNKLRNFYLESQVNNASSGQMLIMLYDCLIEQAEVAEDEIKTLKGANDPTLAAHAITRCINIMRELSTNLRHDVDPTLCGTLSNLYLFFTKELSAAYEKREPRRIRAILPLINELRATWVKADKQAGQAQLQAMIAA
jgi:flagellar biosynthetic protein FliS